MRPISPCGYSPSATSSVFLLSPYQLAFYQSLYPQVRLQRLFCPFLLVWLVGQMACTPSIWRITLMPPTGSVPSFLSSLPLLYPLFWMVRHLLRYIIYFLGPGWLPLIRGRWSSPYCLECTLRCLVAKIASSLVLGDMSALLAPRQLGYGVRSGAESAVHAADWYLRNLHPGHVMLKLNFRNAFNSIQWDKMLCSVLDLSPTIYPLVYSCFSAPSFLFWEGRVLESAEGVQQGDPLGPLFSVLRSASQLNNSVWNSVSCIWMTLYLGVRLTFYNGT